MKKIRKKHKKTKLQSFLNIIIICLIIFASYIYLSNIYQERKIKVQPSEMGAQRTGIQDINQSGYNISLENETVDHIENTNEIESNTESIPVEEPVNTTHANKLKGFNIIATLEIPRINLKTDVLDHYSEEALNVSVTKFYGPKPNEVR